jgi:hypothetical protein
VLAFPEIMVRGGFDAIVGNPPFLGGARISGTYGDEYLSYLLTVNFAAIGNADLSSFFLRRFKILLKNGGIAGVITTNSISKGETRESGLQYLIDTGANIFRATNSITWPGTANVFVSVLHILNGAWEGGSILDGSEVAGISSYLDGHNVEFKPYRLNKNIGFVFRGPTVGGEGFVLDDDERNEILAKSTLCKSVIKKFITGNDINQNPHQVSFRWAIDFGDMDESEAKLYQPCWDRLFSTVRLQRQGNKIKQREQYWWRYIGRQTKLYKAISGFEKVLACGEVSKYWGVSWISANHIFAGKVVVFAISGEAYFAFLNSCFHTEWAEKTASRLKGDPAYSLSETFETLAFPDCLALSSKCPSEEAFKQLESIGSIFYLHRQRLMRDRQDALTTIYNRIHNSSDTSSDISELRALQIKVDLAVAAAYDWQDIDLGHGFHETKQGIRYTISEAARREVLDRLLALNHQRHAEEVAEAAVLAAAMPVKRTRKPKESGGQLTIDM